MKFRDYDYDEPVPIANRLQALQGSYVALSFISESNISMKIACCQIVRCLERVVLPQRYGLNNIIVKLRNLN